LRVYYLRCTVNIEEAQRPDFGLADMLLELSDGRSLPGCRTFTADEFIVGAFIDILKVDPAADFVDKGRIEVRSP
jgi:hypothetical protein